MINFDHILVPFDGSSSSLVALQTAIGLSNQFNSKITAVYVKKTSDDPQSSEISSALDKVKEESGKDIMLLQPVGKMYKEVVNAVAEIEAGLIIMGSHGVSGLKSFGSEAMRSV